MQGYKPQYDDHSHYTDTAGRKVDIDQAVKGHKNAAEILALCNDTYRPEQLHNNGDICDYFNPDMLNLARATHETKSCNTADLAEQAGNSRVLWDALSDSYTQFVRYTQRWKAGYNPDNHMKPDAYFERKVAATKALMKRNSRKRLQITRRAQALGII